MQKFLVLALKANPNILECLFTPLVVRTSEVGDALLEKRSIFLSKLVYQTYNGYVMSQFKKLEQDLRTKEQINWKHAMHLIRASAARNRNSWKLGMCRLPAIRRKSSAFYSFSSCPC